MSDLGSIKDLRALAERQGAEVHVAQAVLFPREGFPAELYLRSEGEGSVRTDPDGAALRGAAGARLSFDTFFNAHYLAYWQRYTCAGRLGVSLRFRGRLDLSIGHVDGTRVAQIVDRQGIEGLDDTPVVVWLGDDDAALPEGGRLSVELYLRSDCRISSVDFVTDAPLRGPVRLSIGICTFNRQTELAATLAEIARCRRAERDIGDVIVVNQGAVISGAAVDRAVADAGARVVEQPNLGGAGGFCRTMVEAGQGTATHHLLMDDDARIDGRMLSNALRILGYLRDDLALGASMFELHAPTRLYEAGGRLLPGWVVDSVGQGTELARDGGLSVFDEVRPVDYSAWWFCIVPVAAIGRAGLPLPVFLHGDDIEYGCRLKGHGVETVAFPGLAVWHDSFGLRNRPWIGYYDLRNILINSALYPQVARPFSPLDLLGWILFRLVMHQYDVARALIRAAEDFLSGADTLAEGDLAARHQALLDTPGGDRTRTIGRDEAVGFRPGPERKYPATIAGIAGLLTLRFLQITLTLGRGGARRIVRGDRLNPANAGPGPYALPRPGHPDRLVVHAPHLPSLWGGTLRALWVSLRFLVRRRAIGRHWRERAPFMTTEAFWLPRFRRPAGGARKR